MSSGDDLLLVGRITSTFGIRGEVKVQSLTDYPAHLKRVKTVLVSMPRRPMVEMTISRLVEHKPGILIIGFQGFNHRDQADELRGAEIFIREDQAAPLAEDEYFLHQLPGLRVVTVEGRELGTVADVLVTGANEVLVVKVDQIEVLIPMIKDVIRRLDVAGGIIEIEPLPGMLPESDSE